MKFDESLSAHGLDDRFLKPVLLDEPVKSSDAAL
jgi:hypothetical protein